MNWSKHLSLIIVGFVSFNVTAQYTMDAVAIDRVTIQNERNINTEHLEFSPFYLRDLLGFIYSDPAASKDPTIDDHYFNLAISAKGIDGQLIKRASLSNSINQKYHEGPAVFDNKKGLLYFTRSGLENSGPGAPDTIYRKIYRASERSNYSEIIPLEINSNSYSVCHPALDRSGRILIVSANDPSTKGQMDLHYTNSNSPKIDSSTNITINSSANEIFPFLWRDSVLLFASDRIGGLGGLDIYSSILTVEGWSDPDRLPAPINSSYDDFGFILDEDGKTGYFSSNRPGGIGKDDLYSYTSEAALFKYVKEAPLVNTHITVLDKLTLETKANAGIIISPISLKNNKYNLEDFDIDVMAGEKRGELLMKLSPKESGSIDTLFTNDAGSVNLNLENDQKYIIRSIVSGYEESYMIFDPLKDDSDINIILNPLPKTSTPAVRQDVFIPIKKGAIVVFNNIYYDSNSSTIKAGAAEELDALADVMLERSTLEVELAAHTDSKGQPSYNQKLSINRAVSAKNYLVAKGISSNRISAIGYGESKIRNQCVDGVACTDEEHRFNRRTEVKITKE